MSKTFQYLDPVFRKIKNIIININGRLEQLNTDVEEDREAFGYSLTVGVNKWNPNTETADKVVSNAASTLGELVVVDGTGCKTSDFISAESGTAVRWDYSNSATEEGALISRSSTAFRIAEYDENKTCLLVTANWTPLPYTVQNANTAYIRLSVVTKLVNSVIFGNTSTSQIKYTPYTEQIDFSRISDIESDITALEEEIGEISDPSEVILPSTIYGVAGQQINIYKQNLMLGNRLKALAYIHTRIPSSVQSDERTIWTPTATTLTEETKPVEIFRYGLLTQESKNIKVCSVPKDTGNSTRKVLICGDSKVQNGYVSYHFLHNFDDDNMSIELLGTKYTWQTENRHEGYGGKTATWLASDSESPFVFNGAFNFAQYMTTKGYSDVDYVFLNFGTNDATQLSSGYAEAFVSAMNTMLSSIHAYNANIKVIIGMCEGVCTFWDTNYAEFLKWDANNKIQRLHKAIIESFDNRQNEGVYVCPMYMGMDLTEDYNMTVVPLSQRDGDVNSGQGNGKTRMQVTDMVHQNEVGYWKNADYMYALVKYIEAKSLA